MDHYFHYLLAGAAVALNWRDRGALALSLIIACTLVLPVASWVTWRGQFYLVCGLVEILVALLALRINTRASHYVAACCAALVAFHILGYTLNGYLQHSPYRYLVKIAEYAEIIACIVLSKPILRLINYAHSRNSGTR